MINCFEPSIGAGDIKNLSLTLKSSTLGFGPNVEEFENQYSKYSNKKFNIGMSSASAAAYVFYQYMFEKCGPCRVYTTSLGFVSPVFAAIKNMHEVIYVDVDDNLLMSPEDLKNKFVGDQQKTSIVMPVLYGGVSNIPGLSSVARSLGCLIILDSAHCVSPTMEHDYSFYSFHPVKPICMSNGGLFSTDNAETAEYFKKARNFGRLATEDSYDLVQSGFNFYMNNLNASLGLSQISKCQKNILKRSRNFDFLRKNIPKELGRFVPHDSGSSYYLCTLILEEGCSSKEMRKFLLKNNIQSSFHYPFLHKTKYYNTTSAVEKLDGFEDRIINLPIHQNLKRGDLKRIVDECIHYSRSRRQP